MERKTEITVKPIVHFVGFRKDECWSAVKVWGKPHYIHRGNDLRMRRDIWEGDTVVFANGYESKIAERNYSDTSEDLKCYD